MKKNTVRENIEKINKISSRFPKSLNEALNFNEEDSFEEDDYGMEAEPEMEMEEPKQGTMDVAAFIDDIRKRALRGMAELADNPLDKNYDILKRIWALCDKAVTEQSQQPSAE